MTDTLDQPIEQRWKELTISYLIIVLLNAPIRRILLFKDNFCHDRGIGSEYYAADNLP